MSLIEAFEKTYALVERKVVPDGAGGYEEAWTDGIDFNAALVSDTTMQARIAEKQGVTSTYTLTVSKSIPLKYGDVFKDKATQETYRITSRDGEKATPSVATFSFQNFKAELYTL